MFKREFAILQKRRVVSVIEISSGKIYQRNTLVLDNINFKLEKNEFVYVIGKTGSGKSSFLKMLYGELPLKEGLGRVSEFDLRNLKKKQIPLLRRDIGIVFQDFQLLMDRTVMKNLFFVMKSTGWRKKKEMQKRALEVLAMVGIENKAERMPHELSGGEQQRVSIARALLNSPSLILADEPTGNLDPATSEEIMQLLTAIAQEGTSVLMATHDMTLVDKFGGRVLRVENGGINEISSINNFNPFEALN